MPQDEGDAARTPREVTVSAGRPAGTARVNAKTRRGRKSLDIETHWDRRSQDRSMQSMVETIAQALGFQFAVFMRQEAERSRVVAGYGVESLRSTELIELCDVPVRLMRLVHAPDPVRHTDLANVALVQHEKGVRFFCGIPLIGPGARVMGTLAVFDLKGRRLSQQQLGMFKGMAKAMEEILSLRSQSVYDDLTGLYNREHFDQQLVKACRRAQRANEPLSTLVLDMDRFELFNRTHGRQAGTEALKRVGELLALRFSRAGDLLGRYRGDEFVLVLGNANASQAEATARRMRKAVRALGIRYRGSDEGLLTASIGLASADPECLLQQDSGKTLLARAYQALRLGQAAGPEQIVTDMNAADKLD